jgi:hypothetical protein
MRYTRLPSIDAIKAVSSPHTLAPALMRISTLKSKGDSKIFVPRSPRGWAGVIRDILP